MKRKRISNLVCQYLENISSEALEKYQSIIKKYVHDRKGIYALYRKNKLYYVGLASNLKSRLKRHLKDRHAGVWDTFSVYLTAGEQHLKELETLLLRIIDRKGNRQRGKFGNAEDLRKKLKNDFRKALSIELENLFCISRPERNDEVKSRIRTIEVETGRRPTLASFVHKRFHIRFRYKDQVYVAHVRKDGSIKFASESAETNRLQGKVFTSPSLAAVEITGKPMNGWFCWKFERAPGDWVFLDELRK